MKNVERYINLLKLNIRNNLLQILIKRKKKVENYKLKEIYKHF